MRTDWVPEHIMCTVHAHTITVHVHIECVSCYHATMSISESRFELSVRRYCPHMVCIDTDYLNRMLYRKLNGGNRAIGQPKMGVQMTFSLEVHGFLP